MNAFMRKATQILLGATLIYTGTLHLTSSRQEFQAQVPPWAPFTPDFIVLASGVVKIALALALISLQRRKAVGIATAAFFIAIFPGNISQFVNHIDAFGLNDDRARAIRLLFQPLLVLWALWSTTAAPKGTFKRFWNYIKRTIFENKAATVIGILIGGVGTRFLEDGNLLVTTVLTGMTTVGTLVIVLLIKKLARHLNQRNIHA
ncbi:COG4270 Predicted membrane protein [Candidatus Nanopelagicaceae bacterium]